MKGLPCYLFHVPRYRDVINYDELEDMVHRKTTLKKMEVDVIDNKSKKRLGPISAEMALLKFR